MLEKLKNISFLFIFSCMTASDDGVYRTTENMCMKFFKEELDRYRLADNAFPGGLNIQKWLIDGNNDPLLEISVGNKTILIESYVKKDTIKKTFYIDKVFFGSRHFVKMFIQLQLWFMTMKYKTVWVETKEPNSYIKLERLDDGSICWSNVIYKSPESVSIPDNKRLREENGF